MYRTTGYDRSLNLIKGLTIELSRAVLVQLKEAIETLENPDDKTDWQEKDTYLNEQRDNIVNRCYNIMSLQQLRDQDLRWILGYQRIAQELERIGDYACEIAEISALHAEGEWPEVLKEMSKHLIKMQEYIVKLMDEAVLEHEQMNLTKEDDFLDCGYAYLREGMIEKGKQKDLVWGLILIQARTIERMGDHIVNIAEALEFIR